MKQNNFNDRIGGKFKTKQGYEIEVIEYNSYQNCTIKFEDGTILYKKSYQSILKGSIKHPKYPRTSTKSDIEGIKINNYGWEMKILEWRDVNDIDVIFLKDGAIAKNRKFYQFRCCSLLHPIFNKLTPKEAERRMNQIIYLKNGHSLKIKEYRAASDIDVIFDDGCIVEHTTYNLFKTGCIAHPLEGRSNKNVFDRIVDHTFTCYKNGAKQRNIEFNMTREQVKRIIFQPCIYCGFEGDDTYAYTKKLGIKYNGIDRIDSNRGYEDGNIVPCCSICNIAKRNKTFTEWIEYLDRLISYYTNNKEHIDNLENKGE